MKVRSELRSEEQNIYKRFALDIYPIILHFWTHHTDILGRYILFVSQTGKRNKREQNKDQIAGKHAPEYVGPISFQWLEHANGLVMEIKKKKKKKKKKNIVIYSI